MIDVPQKVISVCSLELLISVSVLKGVTVKATAMQSGGLDCNGNCFSRLQKLKKTVRLNYETIRKFFIRSGNYH